MKGRIWILVGAALVLGVCYVQFYTEWLSPDPIQIQAQVRDVPARASLDGRGGRAARAAQRQGERPQRRPREGAETAPAETGRFEGLYPVIFALDGEYRLTSVRVIEDQPSKPGRSPLIVWQLDSLSNSVPTKALMYGKTPRGMKLKDERNKPARLQPGVTYRLEIEAGRYKGRITFQAKETAPADGE